MASKSEVPKVLSELDQKRQAAELMVQQYQKVYQQRAVGSLHTLRNLAQQVDLNNPHMSRLMVNCAYAIKHGTDVLTDMTRDELWEQLGLNEEQAENDEEITIIEGTAQTPDDLDQLSPTKSDESSIG